MRRVRGLAGSRCGGLTARARSDLDGSLLVSHTSPAKVTGGFSWHEDCDGRVVVAEGAVGVGVAVEPAA